MTNSMSDDILTIKIITPMMLGGPAPGRTIKCQPRTQLIPALRGELRWWWRAMVGPLAGNDRNLLQSLEATLFGSALNDKQGRQSPIRMRLLCEPRYENVEPGKLPEFANEANGKWVRYLLGPGLIGREERGSGKVNVFNRSRYIPPNNTFTVGVRFASSECEIRELFGALLWVVNRWGGLGARSRRGFGAIEVRWPNGPIPTTDSFDTIVQQTQETLGETPGIRLGPQLPESAASQYPQFRQGHFWEKTVAFSQTPLAALAEMGERWRHHRASQHAPGANYFPQRKTPEWLNVVSPAIHRRAAPNQPFGLGALGMPIQFEKTIGVTVVDAADKPLRLASPVRFKPTSAPSGTFMRIVGFATQPCPPDGHVQARGSTRQVNLALPYGVVQKRVQDAVNALPKRIV